MGDVFRYISNVSRRWGVDVRVENDKPHKRDMLAVCCSCPVHTARRAFFFLFFFAEWSSSGYVAASDPVVRSWRIRTGGWGREADDLARCLFDFCLRV